MPASRDIQRTLARIKSLLPPERQAAFLGRDIKLGLDRVNRVLPDEQKWIAVHVGGTNGKGSICALLAAMFKLSGLSHGVYSSPALPERHNSITINGLYVNRRMYETELQHVDAAYKRVATGYTSGEDPGHLTPFEQETAAAFRLFNKLKVEYGIVEVGMGGGTDATNAMKDKAMTVISKIHLDHQEYLGDTIEKIAKVKAGIMRRGVPCVVDHSNSATVIDVLQQHAQEVGTQITLSSHALPLTEGVDHQRFPLQDYERQNLLCARLAFHKLFPSLSIDVNQLLSLRPQLPGRMEQVRVSGLTSGIREKPVVVDGAHNMLGVEALAKHVDAALRTQSEPVSWVIGLSSSKSKPFSKMIETLVRPQDRLAFVEYTQGPNDPPPAPADLGREVGAQVIDDESRLYDGEPDVAQGVRWACEQAGQGPVVVTGSLYMIRDLYRTDGVEPSRKIKTRRPGSSQLWRLTQLAQERQLTPEEAREFKQARRHWHLSPANSHVFRQSRNGGSGPKPLLVPDNVRRLQKSAAHHREQADGYIHAIRSLKNDMQDGTEDANLSRNLMDLERRRDEHLRSYSSAMFKIRGHLADPERKLMSRDEIFRQR